MDANIHGIEMLQGLIAPQHTAYKTKRRFLRPIGGRRTEPPSNGDPPVLFRHLIVDLGAAGFAQRRETGRFFVIRQITICRNSVIPQNAVSIRAPRARGPPSPNRILTFQKSIGGN